jgi:YebC/PmpR family DNA-binding regulatory protein
MGRGPSIAARKGASDAQRGRLFTKLIREINMAARVGGADPDSNGRLSLAISKALAQNMPKDTIERAIKRASGEGADATQEIRYEGYAPGGVAVMVDCMTDNPTRTVAEVRHAFSKQGGSLGTSGSVAYLFAERGQLLLDAAAADEERVLNEDGWIEVVTDPAAFPAVKAALEASNLPLVEAGVVQRPATTVALVGEDAERVAKLLERLEELDDVQAVYSNAELPG